MEDKYLFAQISGIIWNSNLTVLTILARVLMMLLL
jgi:hypothetical protein